MVRASSDEPVDPAYVSAPRPIEFPTGEGEVAYGFYYPPANPEFEAPAGELPPLIVESHGGPTSHATPALRPRVPLLDQPRDRRRRRQLPRLQRLRPRVPQRAARRLGRGRHRGLRRRRPATWPSRARRTGERLAIRGGSAGGYATLCALTFHDGFAAGASYYGVADAEALARDTHKFESRYLDRLIGPYPERADLYRERSPINHVERLRAPVILFQGLEDEVVPPNQAETMAAALERNGVPYAYLPFEGEQHGFRKAETNIRCLEAELYFYGRIMGFEPAGDPEPVEIVGLG